jgi:hypothetical protein
MLALVAIVVLAALILAGEDIARIFSTINTSIDG